MELEAENPHYDTNRCTYLGKPFIYHEIQTTRLVSSYYNLCHICFSVMLWASLNVVSVWSCSGWQVWLIKLCVCLYKYMHKGVCVCERDTCGYRPKMREREVCVWMSACMLVHEWLCRAFSVGMYLQGITGPAFGCGMTPSWGPAGPSGVNRWSGCLLSQWVLSVTASC